MQYFAKNLIYLREKLGMSKSNLAKKINVNQSTITRWEKEEMMPTVEKAYELSLVLNTSLPDLLGKDLTVEKSEESNGEDELKLLTETLKRKGFLDENEQMTKENFKMLIDFAKANKQFIMKDDK